MFWHSPEPWDRPTSYLPPLSPLLESAKKRNVRLGKNV